MTGVLDEDRSPVREPADAVAGSPTFPQLNYATPFAEDPSRTNPWIAATGCAALPTFGAVMLLLAWTGVVRWNGFVGIGLICMFGSPLLILTAIIKLFDCAAYERDRRGGIPSDVRRRFMAVVTVLVVDSVAFVSFLCIAMLIR